TSAKVTGGSRLTQVLPSAEAVTTLPVDDFSMRGELFSLACSKRRTRLLPNWFTRSSSECGERALFLGAMMSSRISIKKRIGTNRQSNDSQIGGCAMGSVLTIT